MCKDETMRKLADLEEKVLATVEMETMAGMAAVDTEELGKAVDMLKDIAEAKYYCSIVIAMEEEAEGEPMGYNRRRYASGRFAPRGRGSMGYEPMDGMAYDGMGYEAGGMMGAAGSSGGSQGGSQGGSGRSGMGYGYGYERYQQARMGYQQSKTAPNKRAMDEAAEEHLEEVMDSVREIWQDADAGARVRMKNALVGFVNQELK